MRCDCCGKRKCILESFEDIHYEKKTLHVCVKCSTLIYKIRDAYNSKQANLPDLIEALEKRESPTSTEFKKWFSEKIVKI